MTRCFLCNTYVFIAYTNIIVNWTEQLEMMLKVKKESKMNKKNIFMFSVVSV